MDPSYSSCEDISVVKEKMGTSSKHRHLHDQPSLIPRQSQPRNHIHTLTNVRESPCNLGNSNNSFPFISLRRKIQSSIPSPDVYISERPSKIRATAKPISKAGPTPTIQNKSPLSSSSLTARGKPVNQPWATGTQRIDFLRRFSF